MIEAVITSAALSVVMAAMAVIVLFWALRLRDRFARIDWDDIKDRIFEDSNFAASFYCSSWIVGVAIIVGSAL